MVLPQTPFLKLLSLNFAPDRALQVNVEFLLCMESALSGAKFQFKVFGRGYGGRLPTVWGDVSEADRGDRLRQRNLSSERFPPIIHIKLLYEYSPYDICGFFPFTP